MGKAFDRYFTGCETARKKILLHSASPGWDIMGTPLIFPQEREPSVGVAPVLFLLCLVGSVGAKYSILPRVGRWVGI